MDSNIRVMVITGTRKGIGRYLAEYYLDQGFIVCGCSRNETDLSFKNYLHFCLDVSNEVAVKKMISEINKAYGKIDYLVNNAGMASMNHSMLTPVSLVEKIFRTNVFGTFIFSRECAKIMSRAKFGRIVNFSTFAVPFKLEGEAAYAASKAAVVSLTETMSKEYADFGITVNAVAPPAIETDLIRNVPKIKLENLLSRQAIHRFGSPSEVRYVIDFFIDEKNELVTGQTIYLGGI